MKFSKSLLSILILVGINGCATTDTYSEEGVEIIEVDQTKELFYNAFVGNVMEQEGKNNNAIAHYKNILKTQYDKNYFNKLLELYLYKNDFISARSLIKESDINHIKENHKNFEIIYYIANEQYNNAYDILKERADYIQKNSNQPMAELSKYYYDFIKLNIFFFQDTTEDPFIDSLERKNKSQYSLLKNYKIDFRKDIDKVALSESDLIDFNGVEYSLIKMKIFLKNKNIEDFKYLIKDDNFTMIEKQIFSDYILTQLTADRKYHDLLDLIEFNSKNGIEKDNKIIFHQFNGYFLTFQNNDALYSLDLIKDYIKEDHYFYFKAISNYRLGYKNAAKKYMIHVKDKKLIEVDFFAYVDIMGENDLFKNELFNDVSDIEKNLILLNYFVKKNDKFKSILYFDNIKEIIDETGEQFEYQPILKDAEIVFLSKFDNNKALTILKDNYEKEPSLINANSYLYSLVSNNQFDLDTASLIYEKHKNELDAHPSYIDTKSMYLLKINKPSKALKLYMDNNLLYFNDDEVQKNISNVYKSLKMDDKSNTHLDYSKSIFQ